MAAGLTSDVAPCRRIGSDRCLSRGALDILLTTCYPDQIGYNRQVVGADVRSRPRRRRFQLRRVPDVVDSDQRRCRHPHDPASEGEPGTGPGLRERVDQPQGADPVVALVLRGDVEVSDQDGGLAARQRLQQASVLRFDPAR